MKLFSIVVSIMLFLLADIPLLLVVTTPNDWSAAAPVLSFLALTVFMAFCIFFSSRGSE